MFGMLFLILTTSLECFVHGFCFSNNGLNVLPWTSFTCYTKDNQQGCFRLSNWFSLRRLGPWMNHLLEYFVHGFCFSNNGLNVLPWTSFTCYTKDNQQGCFRLSNWFSLRRLGPWMNHLLEYFVHGFCFSNNGLNVLPWTSFTCYTKDTQQGCFRLSNCVSLRRLWPWMNHLPPAW